MKELREKLAALKTEAEAIIAAADGGERDLTAEETARIETISAEAERLQKQISARDAVAGVASVAAMSSGRQTTDTASTAVVAPPAALGAGGQVADGGGPRITGGGIRNDVVDGSFGWRNLGEQAMAIRAHAVGGGAPDPRLISDAAATTFGSEGVGADGGFAVAPAFSAAIRSHALEEDALLPLTDMTPVEGNSMTFPQSEQTPWGGTGVYASWTAEGVAAGQRKPVLNQKTLRLARLTALVPMTDELLADASALGSFLTTQTGRSIRWETNDALVNGNGIGKPRGIFVSGALVSVAKDGSQTADTITIGNVTNMFGRLMSNTNASTRWLVNHDGLPQIMQLTIGNHPVFTPPVAGITMAPNGMLLGIPIIKSQTCQTVGDKGDIYLADWSQYASITKTSGVEVATSIHLFFDANTTAFRATFRVDGDTWADAGVTPENGTNTLGSFITTDARA